MNGDTDWRFFGKMAGMATAGSEHHSYGDSVWIDKSVTDIKKLFVGNSKTDKPANSKVKKQE